jgi:hypothetical protein
MGLGPLLAGAGILLLARLSTDVSFLTDLLPALLVFALGLSLTAAPLTATVLADADESDAGIASAVNNAVARIAGLIAVAVVGAVVTSTLDGGVVAANQRSVHAFHEAMLICAALFAVGGAIGAVGIADPGRDSRRRPAPAAARRCIGGFATAGGLTESSAPRRDHRACRAARSLPVCPTPSGVRLGQAALAWRASAP